MYSGEIPKEIYEEVKDSYFKQLIVPNKKSDNQFFLCPVGFIGSGKSTVLKLLSNYFSLVIISTDELRKLFREHGYVKPVDGEAARIAADELAEYFAQQGYNIAFDSNCITGKEKFERRANRLSVKLFWIHINPPEEFILNKLKKYQHTWLFKDAEHALQRYFYHKDRTPKTDINFLYTFDTAQENLQEQVKECVNLIKQELLN